MKNRIKILLTLSALIFHTSGYSQILKPDWTFNTNEKVLASPVHEDGIVYVGSQNGTFYALDLQSGKEMWKFETEGNIQAKALLLTDAVFFESANVFYLLNLKSGKEIWKFDTQMEPFNFKYKEREWPYKIDPFDDKRSSAIEYEGIIYTGSGNGKVYGFDSKTGKVKLELKADDNVPVRSTPFLSNNRLFFGDWNGVVYCYSLKQEKTLWKKKTYRGEKPYMTFGGVVSEFVSYDELLFMGSRNYMMNVLLEETGEKEWTYTDPDRGWMIGDPVIYSDTLFIGGSDNFSMYAFDPNTGQPLWSHNGGKNIYTKPIVTDKWLVYTSGNGYKPDETGMVYVLDRMTGKELAKYETTKGIFSSPSLIGDRIVFGCYDGNVHALKLE